MKKTAYVAPTLLCKDLIENIILASDITPQEVGVSWNWEKDLGQ